MTADRRELADIRRELDDIKASLLPTVRKAIKDLGRSQAQLYARLLQPGR